MKAITTLLIGLLTLGAAAPPDPAPQQQNRPTVIVVVGAPGTPEFGAQFAEWTDRWEKAAAKGNAEFVKIGTGDTENQPDRDKLQKILAEESEQTAAALWLVLIGHGTFDGRTAKFNLRGPDVSAGDLAQWLRPMVRPVAVINAASSSAPFLKKLSAPNRIVITATKSGFEQNYARFGQYLAEAILEPESDLDKDGQTSLLEAFLTAAGRVREFYAAAGRLATEHALLDDNGDALGTRADWFRGIRPVQKAAENAPLDGYRAHQLHLVNSEAEKKMPPQLRTKRDRLELEVMKLRDAKEDFPEDEYYSKLEALLCDIARIYNQTDIPDDNPK